MAKTTKKTNTEKSTVKKTVSTFDFINGLTKNKRDWDSFSDVDKKVFQPFIINRWLSMDLNLIELVNVFQQYTVGVLDSREVYKLYKGVLPKQNIYLKYIKGKKDNKYDSELLNFMQLYYGVGKKEIKEYLDIMMETPEGIDKVIEILQKFGNDEKKIKNMLKISIS